MKKLYALRTLPEGWCVLTCNEKFDYLGSYLIAPQEEGLVCSCPATKECKHLKMLTKFQETSRQDTPYFLDFEADRWVKIR